MKIAILNVTGGGFSGGYHKYLLNMLPRLDQSDECTAVLCFCPFTSNVPSWFEKMDKIQFSFCAPFSLPHMLHRPDRQMRTALEKFGADVLFIPMDRCVRIKTAPTVNMVRNMEPFIPNFSRDTIGERLKKFAQRRLTIRAVRHANHTIAVSDFVNDVIQAEMGVHQEQITRVYHGLSVSTKPSSARPESIPEGWDGDFLFTCGSVRPARGLEDAVRVLAELKKYGHHPRLVIAGEIVPAMKAYHREITDWLVKHNLQQQVCWTGRLNQEQMNWCYQNTRLLIMTTRIEACPNIAIEALANGVNTISTNCPPMPEFFGDLVTYYTPGDTSLLAKGIMENLAFEPEQVRARSEAMRNQSRRFSWDKTAAQTLAVLKQALVDFRQTKERNL